MFAVGVKRNITEDDIYRSLGLFIKTIFDGEIVRGMANKVSMPKFGKNFIVIEALYSNIYSTTKTKYNRENEEATFYKTTVAAYQIDCYGNDSFSIADSLTTMIRTEYACDFFRENGNILQPLYASDARQLTFINSARQYEERWSFDVKVQPNATTTLPQEFMDSVKLKLKPIF